VWKFDFKSVFKRISFLDKSRHTLKTTTRYFAKYGYNVQNARRIGFIAIGICAWNCSFSSVFFLFATKNTRSNRLSKKLSEREESEKGVCICERETRVHGREGIVTENNASGKSAGNHAVSMPFCRFHGN